MRNTLKFNIRNQNISRIDNFLPVRNSRNYLYAEFNFMTCDWNNVQKTALFKSNTAGTIPVILGVTDTCLIPREVLEDTAFTVSVYGGDLITVDSATVKLYESGYKSGDISEPTPDVYEQIINILQNKADGMKYENNILSLLSGDNIVATVHITGGSSGGVDAREIELQNDGTYIQWRYAGELAWTNLVALSDITGPEGQPGKDGAPGENGLDGASGIPVRQEMAVSDTTAELNTNILYAFPEMESLSLTFAAPTDTSIVNEYHIIFTSGSTATTLTIPDTIKIPSGFSVDANKVYEISILEGCLCCQSWEVDASA